MGLANCRSGRGLLWAERAGHATIPLSHRAEQHLKPVPLLASTRDEKTTEWARSSPADIKSPAQS